MMWRASIASSRTVILLPGSGRPLELAKVDFVSPSSRARLVISFGEGGSVLAMPSASAMQESLPLWMIAPCSRSSTYAAVDGREHGRAAGRRAALAPGIFADPVFIGGLDLALLERVEDHFHRHQLHHAGRRAQFVGVLLEQDAAAFRLDQDRGRRVAVVPVRPSWRPARCCWRHRPCLQPTHGRRTAATSGQTAQSDVTRSRAVRIWLPCPVLRIAL